MVVVPLHIVLVPVDDASLINWLEFLLHELIWNCTKGTMILQTSSETNLRH